MLNLNALIPGAAASCIAIFVMRWLIQRNENAYAKKCQLIFSKHRFDSPSRVEIEQAVRTLNEQNANYMLAVKDTCNVPLRGKAVTLVHGNVGSMNANGPVPAFSSSLSIYALAWDGQREWFESNSDLFQAGVSADNIVAFWVRLDALVKALA